MTDILKMKCPICGKPAARTDAEFPFCSDRCRTIDLGNWASEKYVISSPAISSSTMDPREIRDRDSSERHDED